MIKERRWVICDTEGCDRRFPDIDNPHETDGMTIRLEARRASAFNQIFDSDHCSFHYPKERAARFQHMKVDL